MFKPHKIRNIDINTCNCEKKIAYNFLFSYSHMNKSSFLDFCQKYLSREKDGSMKKYDIDLVYHYLLNSYDSYVSGKNKILTSYVDIGLLIQG